MTNYRNLTKLTRSIYKRTRDKRRAINKEKIESQEKKEYRIRLKDQNKTRKTDLNYMNHMIDKNRENTTHLEAIPADYSGIILVIQPK